MFESLYTKRKQVHQRVVRRFSATISNVAAFLFIFSALLTFSNWPAYSVIIQDMIDPGSMASIMQQSRADEEFQLISERVMSQFPEVDMHLKQQEKEFQLTSLGELYPEEMRLEIPKLFSGTIPVNDVDVTDFSFKDLYSSENKIQEALRTGTVHYPYTANPDQAGNVFITGHSSYYPWDEGQYKEIFALLHTLEVGDEYSIYFKGKKYTYRVTEMYEVQPDDVSVLEQPLGTYGSTLMTCSPVGTTLRRLIVKADLIE
ncbi:MAG: class E sortase [Candidatus Gracilibacteria bacterium]|nr:class E sortase [Candidatus Gracilibacteria bacterium]